MSNVLIGIIGVILFIGLALAGALFPGPRFQEATLNSKGAATVQAVNQVAHAAELRNLSTGVPMSAVADSIGKLASEGWLESVSANPSGGSGLFLQAIDGGATGPAHIVVAVLPREAGSKALCEAVVRQTSGTMIDGATTMATDAAGCVMASTDPLHFAVYSTIR